MKEKISWVAEKAIKARKQVSVKVKERVKRMAKLNRQEHTKPAKRKAAQKLNPVAVAHKPKDITANPVGRPVTYNIEIGRQICDRVANGETITSICKDDPNMPALQTFYNWMNRPEGRELLELYAQAKERCAETLFFEQVDIAKASTKENIGPARLQADVLDRVAARLSPTKYSERYLTVSNGSDNRANIINVVFMTPDTRPEPVIIEHSATDTASDEQDD